MRRPSAAVDLSRGQPAAPLGCVPKRGESWLPIGRKALVGAAYLAPVDLVRPMVPEEFEVVSVLPGRTLATVFVADYGPGSTLEYHEFGLQPALVRFRGVTAAWNGLLLVDSPASVRGASFSGSESNWLTSSGGRRSGQVVGPRAIARATWRPGGRPHPVAPGPAAAARHPVRAAMVRDDMVLACSSRLRSRSRWSTVHVAPAEDGPAGCLGRFSRPIVSAVVTDYRGVMADDVRALGFLPHRHPGRIAVEPLGGPSPSPGS
jgi:hypothetical protein